MANRVASPIFVGRRHELERVQAALARAADGTPALVLVAGEAGVGKTRFVHEVTVSAAAAGNRVLEGGCLPLGGEGLPFGAVIEALRGLTRGLSPEEIERLLGSGREELARLMPDLVSDGASETNTRGPDRSAQGRLFEHLLRFLERLADRAPLILLIEDVHWADRSSLELLGFLARNLRHGSIGLIATYRSDDLHRSHPLLPFLAEVERSGRAERVTLAPFDRQELGILAEAITGAAPEPDAFERMAARSQGNAFYAEELLAIGPGDGPLPATLQDVLFARLAGLSEPTRELLRVASAGGARIVTALLAAVTGTAEHALHERLREAVDRHVIVPLADSDREQFVFRHALIQEAIYGDLLPGERLRLHAAYAQSLVTGVGRGANASEAAALAYHWQAAGDLRRALGSWIDAAIAAESIYAFAEAGAHFERALELWEHVPDRRNKAGFDLIELYTRAAAAIQATATSRSISHERAALALIDPIAEPTRAGLLYARLGDSTVFIHDGATAIAAYREAVRLVPAEPPSAARADVLTELGRCLFYMNTETGSKSIAEEAVLVARDVGAATAESSALIVLALHFVADGDVEAGLDTARRARRLSAEVGDVYGVARALTNTAMALVYAGRYHEAVATALEAKVYAERHGLVARFGSANLLWVARSLVELGRWAEARDALAGSRSVIGIVEPDLEFDLLRFAARTGDFEAAGRSAARLRSRPETHFYENLVAAADGLAELALWQGDPFAAKKAIASRMTAFDTHVRIHVTEVGLACSLGLRAEADLAIVARSRRSPANLQSALDTGAAIHARMGAYTEAVDARSRNDLPQARAWLAACDAEVSRLEGASNPDRWASAASAWNELGNPYHTAYAWMREGQAAIMRRDPKRAGRALSDARQVAVQLGAEPLRTAVDALARRSGVRLAGRTMDGLSRREREVLALVAAGRSNGEIGDTLYISKKTASVHVANIKAKLGAESRIGIVNRALGLGILDSHRHLV